MATIGFIGLGSMGQAMASRLLAQGIEVHVWNRTASAADALVAAGARRLRTAEDAFVHGIVVSMLANDAAVSSVFSEKLLQQHPNALHINMASVSRETARTMAARHATAGVRYLGAPVLGRPSVAEAGQLNILVGGTRADIDAASFVFDSLGKRTWQVGDHAADASLVKIGVNYNIIHALGALAESINLVERGGLDPQLFVDILTDASFNGMVYRTYGGLIAQREYFPAAFNAELGLKDLKLAEQAAVELGAALPVAPILHELYDQVVNDEGRRSGDWSIIAEVVRER